LGDSWTWGDSLGQTVSGHNKDDTEYRLSHIYGHHLSSSLNSDFVNFAQPGWSNFAIFENIDSILSQVTNKYKQIYLVITLTENCRELCAHNMWPVRTDFSKDPESLNAFLEDYEARVLTHFKNIVIKYKNVQPLIGRNFTFSYNNNLSILKDMQPEKNWVEILSDYQGLPGYPTNLRILSQMAYNPIENYFRESDIRLFQKFKWEMLEFFSAMSDAINWLDQSTLNFKKATRHPTEMGHKLWADYLLTYFK
jgi:hypothetical protein